jgi:uncharacterized phosphosugar-binding protein
MHADRYLDAIIAKLTEVRASQAEAMAAAARAISEAIAAGGTVWTFGCGHSALLAHEVFYRAGGLMLVNAVEAPGQSLEVRPAPMTSQMERLQGYAQVIADAQPMKAGDVAIVISTSGRNAVPIEMAMAARARGLKVIALTSVAYSHSVASRHPSGKHLADVADVVLDNCAPAGDAVLELPGLPEKIGPSSGAIGAAMLHAVIVQAVANLLEQGIEPPVFLSGNLPEGDAHNERLMRQYADRIHYMSVREEGERDA